MASFTPHARATTVSEDDVRRFFSRVARRGECWEWTGAKDQNGYGRFTWYGREYPAYRWFYQAWTGEFLRATDIDHKCNNPACVRLEHLERVTHGLNVRRGKLDAKRRRFLAMIAAE